MTASMVKPQQDPNAVGRFAMLGGRREKGRTKMMPEWLLTCLRCPNTGEPLQLATSEDLARLAELNERGQLCTRVGRTILAIPSQGLVNENRSWFYSVENEIPCLVPEEAIALGDLG